ncbi:MAG: cyclic nucleotide-binding domain-containing protein [Planctomycetota bacterium]|jgi:CRP-like cAMP-binding protein
MGSGALGKVYRDGEDIIRQGEVGDCMYVILEGRARVLVEEGGREVTLRTANTGEILGEMAIFERVVRSATVRAEGDVRVLTVDKKTFLRRINEDPSLAFRIVETMSKRIRELSAEVARLRGEAGTAGGD